MASKPSPTSAAGADSTADDFKLIKDIGPDVEHRLHEAGVLTFAQLAAMSPTDIAALSNNVADLSAERIAQQDWIGQARKLTTESAPAERPHRATASNDRQPYAEFAIELLLDEDSHVHHTRIVHTADRHEDAWAGWKAARLLKFIAQYATLPSQPVTPAPLPTSTANLSGEPRLRKLEIIPAGATGPRNVLHHGQPFDVHLDLDLTEVTAPSGVLLGYTATIYARSLQDGSRQLVGEARGNFTLTGTLAIKMSGTTLPPGLYRLAAVLTLSVLPAEPDLSVLLEGSLLQFH